MNALAPDLVTIPNLTPADLPCDAEGCEQSPVEWRLVYICGCGWLLCDECGQVNAQDLEDLTVYPHSRCHRCDYIGHGPIRYYDIVQVLERL